MITTSAPAERKRIEYSHLVAIAQAPYTGVAKTPYAPPCLASLPPFADLDDGDSTTFSILIPGDIAVGRRFEDLETPLHEALCDADVGLVDGGGTGFIGYSDIFVIASRPIECLALLLRTLAALDVPICSEVTYQSTDDTVFLRYVGSTWQQISREESLDGFMFMYCSE